MQGLWDTMWYWCSTTAKATLFKSVTPVWRQTRAVLNVTPSIVRGSSTVCVGAWMGMLEGVHAQHFVWVGGWVGWYVCRWVYLWMGGWVGS